MDITLENDMKNMKNMINKYIGPTTNGDYEDTYTYSHTEIIKRTRNMKRLIKKLKEEQIPLKEYCADLYGTYETQGTTKNLAEYMICIYKRIYLRDYCHYDEIYKEIQLELQQLSEPDFRMKY